MQTVDLAIYADVLAAEATALMRRLERTRGRLRQAAIEREARSSLVAEDIGRLERLGLLGAIRERLEIEQVAELTAALRAIERLQAWVEGELEAAETRDAAIEADWGAVAVAGRLPTAQAPDRAEAAGSPGSATGVPEVAA
ncbi:MAG: hypothetical protein U0R69_15775 [Gaiellales bacterium]